jgi:hypothetical protein
MPTLTAVDREKLADAILQAARHGLPWIGYLPEVLGYNDADQAERARLDEIKYEDMEKAAFALLHDLADQFPQLATAIRAIELP